MFRRRELNHVRYQDIICIQVLYAHRRRRFFDYQQRPLSRLGVLCVYLTLSSCVCPWRRVHHRRRFFSYRRMFLSCLGVLCVYFRLSFYVCLGRKEHHRRRFLGCQQRSLDGLTALSVCQRLLLCHGVGVRREVHPSWEVLDSSPCVPCLFSFLPGPGHFASPFHWREPGRRP